MTFGGISHVLLGVDTPLGINQTKVTKVDEQWPDKSWSTSGCWEEEWGKNRLYQLYLWLFNIAMEAMAHRNTNGLPIFHMVIFHGLLVISRWYIYGILSPMLGSITMFVST